MSEPITEERLAEIEALMKSQGQHDPILWVIGDERMSGAQISLALLAEVRRLRDMVAAMNDLYKRDIARFAAAHEAMASRLI